MKGRPLAGSLILWHFPAARRSAKRSPIIIEAESHMHRNRNPCNSFLMVKMASGMDHGRVRSTTTSTDDDDDGRRRRTTWRPSSSYQIMRSWISIGNHTTSSTILILKVLKIARAFRLVQFENFKNLEYLLITVVRFFLYSTFNKLNYEL